MSNDFDSSRAQEIAEKAERKAGVSTTGQILQKHLRQIAELRAKFSLDNIDLIQNKHPNNNRLGLTQEPF